MEGDLLTGVVCMRYGDFCMTFRYPSNLLFMASQTGVTKLLGSSMITSEAKISMMREKYSVQSADISLSCQPFHLLGFIEHANAIFSHDLMHEYSLSICCNDQ